MPTEKIPPFEKGGFEFDSSRGHSFDFFNEVQLHHTNCLDQTTSNGVEHVSFKVASER